jgi:hypothetical protein
VVRERYAGTDVRQVMVHLRVPGHQETRGVATDTGPLLTLVDLVAGVGDRGRGDGDGAVTDVLGKSSCHLLAALAKGEDNPELLADMAEGS